ncbi:hypothetical protein EOD39_16021 [Acipenser ruthenus]|uniref:Uncharacterized protein n=1 Tax=Acipenser ruthenus TaxID=7906 RepID=A0A444V6W4_ACIRT|nr:hypothetical protein EOD39_16021 [Acipenser ruthenus]
MVFCQDLLVTLTGDPEFSRCSPTGYGTFRFECAVDSGLQKLHELRCSDVWRSGQTVRVHTTRGLVSSSHSSSSPSSSSQLQSTMHMLITDPPPVPPPGDAAGETGEMTLLGTVSSRGLQRGSLLFRNSL